MTTQLLTDGIRALQQQMNAYLSSSRQLVVDGELGEKTAVAYFSLTPTQQASARRAFNQRTNHDLDSYLRQEFSAAPLACVSVSQVMTALREVADRYSVDAEWLLFNATQESWGAGCGEAFNLHARHGGSYGLFQFTRATWDWIMPGKPFPSGPLNLAEAAVAGAILMSKNIAHLRELNIPVTKETVYVCHNQGYGGGPKSIVEGKPNIGGISRCALKCIEIAHQQYEMWRSGNENLSSYPQVTIQQVRAGCPNR
jgi:hypothetical protein